MTNSTCDYKDDNIIRIARKPIEVYLYSVMTRLIMYDHIILNTTDSHLGVAEMILRMLRSVGVFERKRVKETKKINIGGEMEERNIITIECSKIGALIGIK